MEVTERCEERVRCWAFSDGEHMLFYSMKGDVSRFVVGFVLFLNEVVLGQIKDLILEGWRW